MKLKYLLPICLLILFSLAACTSSTEPVSVTQSAATATEVVNTAVPAITPTLEIESATPVSAASVTPEVTSTPVVAPTPEEAPAWLTYHNGFYGYVISYPPEAQLTTEGVSGFPTEELPEDMTETAYRNQLAETYPGDICVSLSLGAGSVHILAPEENGGKYAGPCPGLGIGAYDVVEISETVEVNGRSYLAEGFQVNEQDEAATFRSEFFHIQLGDGTQITYVAGPEFSATYETDYEAAQAEYLAAKAQLLQMIESYQPSGQATEPLITEAPAAISSEELAQRIENGLAWTAVSGVDGFPLKQLTGFEYGFRYAGYGYCEFGPYRWLTDDQLMLFPVVGYTTWFENPTGGKVTQALIFNATDSTAWLPDTPRTDVCDLPVWSSSRQQIIEASNGEVRLRDLTGSIAETYAGSQPLFISPSGERLLAGPNWIDLSTGEVVSLNGWPRVKFPRPAWSSDETEIFECCFSYANAVTNENWTRGGFPGVEITGIGVGPGHYGSQSLWLADDTRIMIQPDAIYFQDEAQRPVLPLIEPESQTYVDMIELLDLPETVIDCGPFIAPSGSHLWLSCAERVSDDYQPYAVTYLIALPSLETVPLNGHLMFRGWSSDGRFLTYNEITDEQTNSGATWLMSSTGEQQQLAEQPTDSATWHPTEPIVALRYDDSQQLLFVQVETGQSRRLAFPHKISRLVWQPTGNGVALFAEDIIYWLSDPFAPDSQPVPVTSPMPEVNTLRWSPNGRNIAFISENDFYVVEIVNE